MILFFLWSLKWWSLIILAFAPPPNGSVWGRPSGAIAMQMCGAHDRGKTRETWWGILKSLWFIYRIIPPHLPTSDTSDIKNVDRFDMQMSCAGYKTFCLSAFCRIRLWQRCCLISFLAQRCSIKLQSKMVLVNLFHRSSYTHTHRAFNYHLLLCLFWA